MRSRPPVAVTCLLLLLAAVPVAATDKLPHQPLRTTGVPAVPNPTEPASFDVQAGVPPFRVVAQKPGLTMYPCSNCHKAMTPNATPRKLVAAPHVADLPHGNGRLWCMNCHVLDNRDLLTTSRGERVDLDQAYLVCGGCHGNRQQDWRRGIHGKAASGWRAAERTLYSCTHCHDPHRPAIPARAPAPPPPVRAGLQRRPPGHAGQEAVHPGQAAVPSDPSTGVLR